MIYALLDVYKRGSIKINNEGRGYSKRRTILLSGGKRGAVDVVCIERAHEIFQVLKLDKDIVSTDDLKKGIVLYFKSLNIQDSFLAMSYLLHKYYKLTPVVNDTRISSYLISDGNGIFQMLFNKFGFNFIKVPRKSDRSEVLRIKKGSFFIDGRWIHIG